MGASVRRGRMGALIHFFKLQPFIVTLAGMFLARGAVLPHHDAVDHDQLIPTFKAISAYRLQIGTGSVTANVLIAHRDAGRRDFRRAFHALRAQRLCGRRQSRARRC